MIRRLARAFVCATLLSSALWGAADAASVTGTIAPGQLSTPLPVTASQTVTFTVSNPVSFTIMRSEDGGTTFQPLARDPTGALAHYGGPLSIDMTEQRSGVQYAIQADPGPLSLSYRIDQ